MERFSALLYVCPGGLLSVYASATKYAEQVVEEEENAVK